MRRIVRCAAPQSRDPFVASAKMDPGSAAHYAIRHSASKTRVNALTALRSIRGTMSPVVELSNLAASGPRG
jgi:hypothetical protein